MQPLMRSAIPTPHGVTLSHWGYAVVVAAAPGRCPLGSRPFVVETTPTPKEGT
jgi:hypothetical protein